VSSKTDDDERRADTLEMLLRTAHAHPAVSAVLLWGFWARAHWLGRPAALVEADWTLLPAAHRLAALRDEWTTEVSVLSDEAGVIALAGWAGDYHLAAAGWHGAIQLADGELTARLEPASPA
jgi:hypothetical protein